MIRSTTAEKCINFVRKGVHSFSSCESQGDIFTNRIVVLFNQSIRLLLTLGSHPSDVGTVGRLTGLELLLQLLVAFMQMFGPGLGSSKEVLRGIATALKTLACSLQLMDGAVIRVHLLRAGLTGDRVIFCEVTVDSLVFHRLIRV